MKLLFKIDYHYRISGNFIGGHYNYSLIGGYFDPGDVFPKRLHKTISWGENCRR